MSPARALVATSTVALLVALTGCTGAQPDARSDSSTVADDPTTSPDAETPAASRPTDLRGVTGALEPGTYRLRTFGVPSRPVFEVPDGYYSNGGWIIDAGGGSEPEQLGAVQVWRADRVLRTPCRRRTAETVGPTAADLARALHRQLGPATRPRPTELDGHHGFSLEITVPFGVDMGDEPCPGGGEYTLWLTGGDEGPWHSDRPGIVHHLWILDVDGTRAVVTASNYPEQPTSQHRELIDIAESVRFQPAA
ncbi:hypothetical protein [Nocardioides sp. GXQ0305]|uniref:hypothetical protein n=1 Tax=Nocardioides sp. GXQ0305 TaxID=3423912 RepID=UPI003D7D7A32